MLIQAAIRMATNTGLVSRQKQEVAPVLAAINLDAQGRYLGLVTLTTNTTKGKKVSTQMWVPQRSTRTADVYPEFLVDNAGYILGIPKSTPADKKAKAEARAIEKFTAFRDSIATIAKNTKDEGAIAFLAFLNSPSDVKSCRAEYEQSNDATGNLVVSFKGGYLHDRPALRDYWLGMDSNVHKDEAKCACCGEMKLPAKLHPKVSGGGLRGSLVSFNSNTTDSYGFEGTQNFPVCPDCCAAYSVALQRLLKTDFPHPTTCEPMPRASLTLADSKVDKKQHTTVAVYWPEQGEATIDIRDIFEKGAVSSLPAETDDSLFNYAVLGQLSQGRITVLDYTIDSLSEITKSLRIYYEQLKLDSLPDFVKQPYTPYWYQRAVGRGTEKKAPPAFKLDLFECAMNPRIKFSNWLYNRALNRVAKQGVSPALASLIKAVLIRNYEDKEMKPALNPEHSDPAYQFGCLFAIVEHVHTDAIDPNLTLSDTLYVQAVNRPASVQTKLKRKFDLCIKKDRKLVWHNKRVSEITEHITELPAFFTPKQQGLFTSGYYQQRNELWRSKSAVEPEPPAAI